MNPRSVFMILLLSIVFICADGTGNHKRQEGGETWLLRKAVKSSCFSKVDGVAVQPIYKSSSPQCPQVFTWSLFSSIPFALAYKVMPGLQRLRLQSEDSVLIWHICAFLQSYAALTMSVICLCEYRDTTART